MRVICGDVREKLAELPAGSVQCCVTSPPYFGLRDYGVHGQIGLEPTLAEYVAAMVDVFREVRRVLRDDGTVWLNLGDSYAANRSYQVTDIKHISVGNDMPMRVPDGLKPKDLMMVPARVALALQDDGWWLRSDIIWAKKNCMPESVTDRPTSSHEHIFLLTKSARYFYDADAVREKLTAPAAKGMMFGGSAKHEGYGNNTYSGNVYDATAITGRNQRNVWHLATEPFSEAHFATFPTEIPRRCIKAGTSEHGACAACVAPWVRVVERSIEYTSGSGKAGNPPNGKYAGQPQAISGSYDIRMGPSINTQTTGWQPSCTCDADVVPQTVLDPFLGSGTTLMVADQLGRDGIGIELNPEYAEMAKRRITNDAPLFVSVAD